MLDVLSVMLFLHLILAKRPRSDVMLFLIQNKDNDLEVLA